MQCESCNKWRRVPQSQAEEFSRADAGEWICSVSSHPKINSCDVPQELEDDDIDARIAMGDECPFYDDDDLDPPEIIVHRDSPAPADATPAEATPATPPGALLDPGGGRASPRHEGTGRHRSPTIARALPGRSEFGVVRHRWGLLTRDPKRARADEVPRRTRRVPRHQPRSNDPTEMEDAGPGGHVRRFARAVPWGPSSTGGGVEVTDARECHGAPRTGINWTSTTGRLPCPRAIPRG